MSNRMYLAVVALISLFCVGCIQEYQIGNAVEARVSGSYSKEMAELWEEKVEIASGIWRDALGEGCVDPFPMNGDGPVLPITLYTPEEWEYSDALAFTPADYIDVKGPRKDGEMGFMVDLVVHEMGHVIGLWHNNDPTSIMGLKGAYIPNENDIREAKMFLGCQ